MQIEKLLTNKQNIKYYKAMSNKDKDSWFETHKRKALNKSTLY